MLRSLWRALIVRLSAVFFDEITLDLNFVHHMAHLAWEFYNLMTS